MLSKEVVLQYKFEHLRERHERVKENATSNLACKKVKHGMEERETPSGGIEW